MKKIRNRFKLLILSCLCLVPTFVFASDPSSAPALDVNAVLTPITEVFKASDVILIIGALVSAGFGLWALWTVGRKGFKVLSNVFAGKGFKL